ncbi:hypothetical protein AVXHC19_02520 [Acidovorax sacchari]
MEFGERAFRLRSSAVKAPNCSTKLRTTLIPCRVAATLRPGASGCRPQPARAGLLLERVLRLLARQRLVLAADRQGLGA